MTMDTIWIDEDTVARCFLFAQRFCRADKDGRDFGATERNLNDRIADCAHGKIGEVGLAKIIQRHGYPAAVDMGIWEGGDGGSDILLYDNPVSLDVKAVKGFSSWLLVETRKADSDVYALMRTDLDGDIEKHPEKIKGPVRCQFLGFSPLSGFVHPETGIPYFRYRKGDRLYHPRFIQYLLRKASGKVTRIPEVLEACVEKSPAYRLKCGVPLKCHDQLGLPEVMLSKDVRALVNYF